ncbi:hypothetical protein IS511_11025 [Acinetobacter towneri]|uniref:hypothetical protein n=1 Tax=Acinetobacter towneri TaxID=202956 RepID=UPI00188B9B9C|nr:hypothetical protein [Acinetobacter towneri]MBF4521661.1 hypothetical protein [Acinetobacter towneri]
MTIDTGDIIAFLALVVSIYALYQNHKTNQRQIGLLEMEKELNQFLIKKEKDEIDSRLRADIKGRYFKLTGSNYRLKLWNDGFGNAKNITLSFKDHEDVPLIQSDIEEKFPLDLESKQSVELLASVHYGIPRKHSLIVKWDDESCDGQTKELILTI